MGPEDGKRIMYIWKCNEFVTRLQIDEVAVIQSSHFLKGISLKENGIFSLLG